MVNYSFEEIREKIRTAVKDKFNTGTTSDVWPMRLEPDPPVTKGTTVVEDYNEGKYFRIPFTLKDGEIDLGESVEVERTESFTAIKSRVLAVEKGKDHVMFTGTVLIPGEPDCDFENGETPLTKETVAKMAHEFLLNYRIVDKDHNYFMTNKSVGDPVESWLLDEPKVMKSIDGEDRVYPEGTWVCKSKITEPESMKKAEKGEVAYSVTALPKEKADEFIQSVKSRVLIKDLDDPVGFTISLVENPCVNNSCSAKDASMKAGRSISKQNKSVLEKARDLLNNLISQAEAGINGGDDVTEKSKKEEKSEKSDKDNEYVTKSDFEDFKKDVLKAIKGKEDEEGEPGKSEKSREKEKSEKSDEKGSGESKALKNHDTGKEEVSYKSIESYMGRNKRGRPLKKAKE